MSETKTYVFGNDANAGLASNNLLASILPSLQNRGIDTGYLLGMLNNNGNGGGFFGNNGGFESIIALIVIAAIFGNGNGNGIFGGGGNNNSAEREMLMSAIQRNGTDLSQLAQTLNCSVGQVHNAIDQVATQICSLTGQLGLSSQQIINSVQSGNASIASQICNCCCDLKQLISESNYLTERGFCNTNQILSRGFSDLGYASAQQTCELKGAIKDSTDRIIDGQRAAEMREMQREITERDRRISEQATAINNYQQTQTFGAMLAPLNNAIGNLQSDIDSIKCKLPKTETIIAQPNYVPVNTGINVGLAPYVCGYSGFNNYGGCGYNYGC